MARNDQADHEIGYGKPPRHTRFRPGRSGNPKGRPKGCKNLKTDLLEELGERIPVREGERTRKVSKQRAVIKTLMARTLKGDVRAANLLLGLMTRLLDLSEGMGDSTEPLKDDELEILKTFGAQLRRDGDGAVGPADRGEEAAP